MGGVRRTVGAQAPYWVFLAAVVVVVGGSGLPVAADHAPILTASQLGWLGWTDNECETDGLQRTCYFAHDAAVLGITGSDLGPSDPAESHLQVQTALCEGSTPIDVEGRPLTVGCTSPEMSHLVFANRSWVFNAVLIEFGDPPWETGDFLLDVRERQLALAGGEPESGTESPVPDAADLDRYIPSVGPAGFDPPGGAAADLDTFGSLTEDDVEFSRSDLEFLQRQAKSRARLWLDVDSGRSVAVIVDEYPYEVLAGLVLGLRPEAATAAAPAAASEGIENLVAFEVDGDGGPFLWEGFRRGRHAFWVVAGGADVASREQLAADMVQRVAELAPAGGATAPIQFPTAVESVGKAAAATALAGAAVLILRRALAGRARRAKAIEAPRPVVVDVSVQASALRRRGRMLAAIQVASCAAVVVGLVADIGWWWVAVAAAGLVVGVGATTLARRRELEGALRYRPQASWRALVLGAAGAVLLVGGIGLAVRGLKELVFLPSIAQLRLAERFSIAPEPLAAAMTAVGVGALVVGGFVVRRARAHARADPARLRRIDPRPPILYLRSFEDDRLAVPSVQSARRSFLELFSLRGRDSFEEGIAWELAANGPVVAVARPDGSTASLGAARELLDQSTWQQDVAVRMRDAGAIILAVGESPGLAWEVGEVVRSGHLGKTRFIVPPADPEQVVDRWAATCRALDQAAGRLLVPPVNIVGGLTARIDPHSNTVIATWADRLDEAAYRAAVDSALRT